MRIRALAIAGMLWMLAGCQAAPRPASGLSTLQLRVVAEPKAGAAPAGQNVRTYDAPARKTYGAFEPVDYGNLDHIVVWAEPTGANPSAGDMAPIGITVDSRTPAAKLTPASVGQTIAFRNAGPRPMNLYSVSDGNDFDLGSVAPGGVARYTVRGPGLMEVLTDSLDRPVATLYAAPSRWVALARSGETITFENLPPGDYRVVSWHPRIPGSQTTVTLRANEVGTASVKVGVNSLPKDQWR